MQILQVFVSLTPFWAIGVIVFYSFAIWKQMFPEQIKIRKVLPLKIVQKMAVGIGAIMFGVVSGNLFLILLILSIGFRMLFGI